MSSHQPLPTGLAALRAPYVGRFLIGRTAGMMGSQFISVAVGWELYERTHDAWVLGLVGLAQIVPSLALMLPAGNIADRFPRRNVALGAQAMLVSSAVGLTLVSLSGAPIWLVFAMLVLSGIGRAFSGPSTGTLLPQLIGPREFAASVPWMISSGHLASIGGPALGGILIALTLAATPSYATAAVFQLVWVGILLSLPVVPPDPSAAQRSWRDLFAGIHYIRRSHVFLAAITLDLFAVLLGGAVALLPVYAKDILAVGPAGLGVLRSAPSLGALLASLTATRLPPWRRPGRVLVICVTVFGLATIAFGLSRNLVFSLACLFVIGAFDSISMVIRQTLQQVITPDRLRGRVAAVGQLFTGLSNEMGAFESGATAALFGPVISVVGGGIGTLAVVAVVLLSFPALARIGPLHTLRPTDADADPLPAGAAAARA